jgi:D-glycero-alpha-D-manno-heptose 1-phosphate guanylyltransferase
MFNQDNKDSSNLSSPFRGTGGEAIVLAGGLGTRLKEAVPDLPKCMAPVAGRPFLSYVIDALRLQGVHRFVFSLGYKSVTIEDYLANHYPTLHYTTVIEEEPLGTGGAIQLAMQQCETENVLVVNGDTLFKVNVAAMEQVHMANKAECTLALKPMQDFDRYGVVEIDEKGTIVSFKEKQHYTKGLINGGVYLINKQRFLQHSFGEKFSFEKDYLEKYVDQQQFFGSVQEGYFIDIGIPSDYQKAQADLQRPALNLKDVDKNWTLFLDRDGVINDERVGEYVLNWDQFIFSHGVLKAFKLLSQRFERVFIVSNQRGVGKALMTEADLQAIHKEMLKEVNSVDGQVDNIYYCIEKDDKYFHRKPNPGMAIQAFRDYPDIDQNKCIMVGNKPSDMRFGRAAGMFTVFLTTTNPNEPYPHPDVDFRFSSLLEFAQALQS